MRRRKARPRDLVRHRQRGDHPGTGLAEVEHHAVAQPLDRPPAMLDRDARDEPSEDVGEVGRGHVPPLARQSREARDVEEAHRRRPFLGSDDPRRGELSGDPLDDVRGIGIPELGPVHRHQGILDGS